MSLSTTLGYDLLTHDKGKGKFPIWTIGWDDPKRALSHALGEFICSSPFWIKGSDGRGVMSRYPYSDKIIYKQIK